MDMEGALRARLLAAAGVSSRVGNRVYWDTRPQASALPAITLNFISDERDQHLGGFQKVQQGLVQADVWATSFAEKKALKEAVIAALAPAHTGNGIRFQPATRITARPMNERTETQFIFRDAIDFQLTFSNT